MSDLKITIDHLKNYLGTGLTVHIDEYSEEPETLNGIFDGAEEVQTNVDVAPFDLVRPICYRLSDLDKFIPELGFITADKIYKDGWSERQLALLCQKAYTHVAFDLMQQLFQWHFWPFGEEYFEEGLVIDKLKQGKEESNAH